MENRKEKRVKTRDRVNGKIILVEHLEILDISLSGIHFNCLKKRRLEMNSLHTIKISKDDVSVTLQGTVVRSNIKSAKDTKSNNAPVYEVAMKFTGLNDGQKASIEKLILLLGNE